jgi:hypothetical protein
MSEHNRRKQARERDYIRGIRHWVDVWQELARKPWLVE